MSKIWKLQLSSTNHDPKIDHNCCTKKMIFLCTGSHSGCKLEKDGNENYFFFFGQLNFAGFGRCFRC